MLPLLFTNDCCPQGVERLKRGFFWRAVWGPLRGYGCCLLQWSRRKPVRPSIYRLVRHMKGRGPIPLEQIEATLESVRTDGSKSPLGRKPNPKV